MEHGPMIRRLDEGREVGASTDRLSRDAASSYTLSDQRANSISGRF